MSFWSLRSPDVEEAALPWRMLNGVLLAAGLALVAAYLFIAVVTEREPYDYALLMRSAIIFCEDQAHFAYGVTQYSDGQPQRSFYPAPFYSAFCVPYRHAHDGLLMVWLLIPVIWVLALGQRRAALLAYPPLFVLLLGQSTGWLIPLYFLAASKRAPRWWHGVFLGAALFKPHIAILAVVILLWRWRKTPSALFVGAVTCLGLLIPAFLQFPGWLGVWLKNGRGFEPVNLASVARIPVRGLNLQFVTTPGMLVLVWGFAIGVALFVAWLLWQRRGRLTVYDLVLIFCFTLPLINDYDLVILLPFLVQRPKRMLIALAAGLPAWLYAMMTTQPTMPLGFYNLSVLITLALIAERVLDLRKGPFVETVRKPSGMEESI